MKTCMFYTWKHENECFYVFSPFSAYFSPHYILVEKGLFAKAYHLVIAWAPPIGLWEYVYLYTLVA